MSDEDLFYKDVEGRMEELKQNQSRRKKKPAGKRLVRLFTHLGFNDSNWFTLYFTGNFEVGL